MYTFCRVYASGERIRDAVAINYAHGHTSLVVPHSWERSALAVLLNSLRFLSDTLLFTFSVHRSKCHVLARLKTKGALFAAIAQLIDMVQGICQSTRQRVLHSVTLAALFPLSGLRCENNYGSKSMGHVEQSQGPLKISNPAVIDYNPYSL